MSTRFLSTAQQCQRDALVLQYLPLADRLGRAMARRLSPLVEADDLIQVAREALLHSALRCHPGCSPGPYLRRCINGALRHHLRDQVRLVRVPRRLHERRCCPFSHDSLDAPHPEGGAWLDHLDSVAPLAPSAEQPLAAPMEVLLERLPAAESAALRLTLLEGLTLRAAAERLQVSPTSVQRFQRRGVSALRNQLTAV